MGGPDFFVDLLKRFQVMMHDRTRQAFDEFFGPLYQRYGQDEQLDELTTYLLAFCIHPKFGLSPGFGFRQLAGLPQKPFKPALNCALALMARWKPYHDEALCLIHDASSSMAKQREIWDALVSPSVPPARVGYAGRITSFPLMVGETRFEASRDWAGLQLADVLAGAMAYRLKWYIAGRDPSDAYGAALARVPWDVFDAHVIWPTSDVTPESLGAIGQDGEDAIEHAVRVLTAAGVKPR